MIPEANYLGIYIYIYNIYYRISFTIFIPIVMLENKGKKSTSAILGKMGIENSDEKPTVSPKCH